MKVSLQIPEKIRGEFLHEILYMYVNGELSASRAAQMLGVSRAAFYALLAETKTPLPQKLNESIMRELVRCGNRQIYLYCSYKDEQKRIGILSTGKYKLLQGRKPHEKLTFQQKYSI